MYRILGSFHFFIKKELIDFLGSCRGCPVDLTLAFSIYGDVELYEDLNKGTHVMLFFGLPWSKNFKYGVINGKVDTIASRQVSSTRICYVLVIESSNVTFPPPSNNTCIFITSKYTHIQYAYICIHTHVQYVLQHYYLQEIALY